MVWYGMVWCNPPYGNEATKWLKKCAEHGNCIALIFARTDTKMFHQEIFNKANSLLFIEGRLSFYHVTGKKSGTSGSPSVLVSYGEQCSKILETTSIRGKFIKLK